MRSLRLIWRAGLGLLAVALIACTAFGGHIPAIWGAPHYNAKPSDLTSKGKFFGFAAPTAPDNASATKKLISTAGCNPGVIEWFMRASNPVYAGKLTRTSKNFNAIPLVTLEPWSSNEYGPNHPEWALKTIINGQHDKDFKAVARQMATYHGPVLLRFAHEMNGNFYPWGAVGTNTPPQYIAAWRHVWTIFKQANASNVLWVWAPNNGPRSYAQAAVYYPGDAYVDFVGLSGYGINRTMPAQAYGPLIKVVRTVTRKPMFLSEMGTNANPAKSEWIAALGRWLAATPDVRGFVWFDYPQGKGQSTDWRFDQTSANLNAFKQTLKTGHINCSVPK
jgi:hypothetical protein